MKTTLWSHPTLAANWKVHRQENVRWWWNPHYRLWVVCSVDAQEKQIGDAHYLPKASVPAMVEYLIKNPKG